MSEMSVEIGEEAGWLLRAMERTVSTVPASGFLDFHIKWLLAVDWEASWKQGKTPLIAQMWK